MLKKLKVTFYAFIYFLMFGFSFIALQVTIVEVEAAGVCEPIAGIRNLKGTPRDKDYKLWVSRCQISGQKGNCGVAGPHWPQGDSGRCETTTAEAGAAHDNIGVCEPIPSIRNLEGTAKHSDYTLWAERCLISGQNGNCGDAGTRWPQGDSGRCEMTTADQEIVECKVAVYAVFNELRSCMQQAMATPPVPNGDYDKAWEGVIACTNSLPRDYVGTVMEPYWYT